MRSNDVEILPVGTRRTRRAFLDLPRRLYRDDPIWRGPLTIERRLHVSRYNPYFEHARWQGFLAMRGGEPVGRISAQVDDLHRARYGPDTGHFGMLEAVDDGAVFAALLGAAEAWLRERGTRRVTGPFSFSVNQECGLLVEGFDTPPAVMMPHGRPWYGPRLEALGYRQARDLLAYWINTDFEPPPVMVALLKRYQKRIRIRTMQRSRFRQELELLSELFNDAWSENWGFVPFTEAEFAELGLLLRLAVPDDLIQIAELDGEPAAFVVGLPDLNAAARDLDGRLLPFGWARLLWRLKRGLVPTGRVPLMGVRKRLQKSTLGSALALGVIGAVKQTLFRRGIRHVELSWILEDNAGMRSILEAIGSDLYKRYRLYSRDLRG
ncbi:MAG: N-acetyltransferase [Gammaproteobacteria bacterium]|nr:N-acetyltransferase [Gammaproteobacteria bacterium]